MEIPQVDRNEIQVYDLNEMATHTNFPAKVARLAIQEFIGPIVQNDYDLELICLGLGEIIKDVEVHGSELEPRLIIVQKGLGGVAIDTVNKIKANSDSNGFGRIIIEDIFGDSYSSEINDDTYFGHLSIVEKSPDHQISRNVFAA